ncbi:MAG: hypothetical protein J5J04_07870 [Anaerolineae bacterium]|jgi:hypothetical protein|nr:MAG: hypothetical protein UZ13_01035 [Chloroflexi bacterium OLB13]MBC6957596.1 hypothetical protein [Chloroflexota bacterium]MBV6436622.1 hypothetical protein [Anaerolineae bacterium]MDL1917347.1 hypothetical protein [Anaerolineae bacterium CFX4]MBW7880032.1 hypothetical protein [Anaerolineae bacterium]
MHAAPTRTVFSHITDFLATNPTPQEIISYQLPPELEARALDLLERNGEGLLSVEEHQEMVDFMRAEEMMSLLKAKTRLKLKKSTE